MDMLKGMHFFFFFDFWFVEVIEWQEGNISEGSNLWSLDLGP